MAGGNGSGSLRISAGDNRSRPRLKCVPYLARGGGHANRRSKDTVPRRDALRTATVNPARFLKQPNSFGQIAPGQRADMLLVDGNPLEDLRALQRLHGIVLRGKWIDAGQLANSVAALVN